jgi:hypothetical protein
MSYIENEKFEDHLGQTIELSKTSWEHIQDSHPEIRLEDIRFALKVPLEVRESPRQNFVQLFYRAKNHPKGKPRYQVVVVKTLNSGLFISTAMTTGAMKAGRTIYRRVAI